MRRLVCLVVIAVLALPADALTQECIEFTVDRDNTLYEDAGGTLSNGAGSYLFAGRTNQTVGSIRRAVIHFDLAASLEPADTINITQVQLFTYVSKVSGGAAQALYLHRLRNDWGEGASDAIGEEGAGAVAAPDDATWMHTFFDSSLWQTPGGDFDTISSGVLNVQDTGRYEWWLNQKAAQDIFDWMTEPSTNFGWIVLGNESESGTATRIDSRENPLTAFGPTLRLTIGYTDCWCDYQGDMNQDLFWDAIDLNVLIQTLFFNGPNPHDPFCVGPRADLDCDGFVDALDLNYMIDLLFFGGPPPCDPCSFDNPCVGFPQ